MAFKFLKKLAQSKRVSETEASLDGGPPSELALSSYSSTSSSFISTSTYSRKSGGSTKYHIPFDQREPETWSTNDVCLWLTSIGLSSYADAFQSNDVTGKELVDLELSELKHLGIQKWGHRKKLMRKLQLLKGEAVSTYSATDSLCDSQTGTSQYSQCHSHHSQQHTYNNSRLNLQGNTNSHNNNNNNNASTTYDLSSFDESSATASFRQDELLVKCIFNDREGGDNVRVLQYSRDQPFQIFLNRLKTEAGLTPSDASSTSSASKGDPELVIQFTDVEGDKVTIRDKSDFEVALTCAKQESFLKLWISIKNWSPTMPSKKPQLRKTSSAGILQTSGILESLTDGAIIIDTKGIIKFANGSATKLFQYSREELMGRNVSMLMEHRVARRHDGYIQRYLRTGKRKVLGAGRQVTGVKKDGSRIKLWLTASENMDSDDHVFVATLHQIDQDSSYSSADEETFQENQAKKTESPQKSTFDEEDEYENQAKYTEGVKGLMQSLMEAAILTNNHGNVVYMNNAAEKLLEFKYEDLVGHSVQKIIPKAYISHDEQFQDYIRTGGSKALGQAWDTVLQTKIGAIIPVTMSLSLFEQSSDIVFFLNIIRPRTVNSDMDKSVLQQEREVVGNLALPGIIIDETCRIQGFNEAACKFLGYTLMDVLGKNVTVIMPPGSHRTNHDDYVHQYLNSGKGSIIRKTDRELNAMDKAGNTLPIWLSVTERKLEDGKRIFTGILHPRK